MTEIIPLPVLTDNYIWLIKGTPSHAAIVDPGVAEPVLSYLDSNNMELDYILITHHHWDHTNGIEEIIQEYPNIPVFGPAHEKVEHVTHPVQEGDVINLDKIGARYQVLDIPGHTAGHIAYYDDKHLFCGDTLFLCGCGRLFEGSPQQMFESLNKLKALDGQLLVCCAHEYTQANLNFCLTVEPQNKALQERMAQVKQMRALKKPTVPASLALEKACNPFLRCDEQSVAQSVQKHSGTQETSALSVFTHLRAWKDNF